ncbi:MAG: hypothetical protein KDD66_11165 [Bdellovibrionales bacterium]|nr:hypothetical protein [Bdellovibrionales bacterium]
MTEELPAKKKKFGYARGNYSVLVVCQNGSRSNQIRQALKTLGFAQISAAPTHVTALERFKVRKFSHVIFESSATDMPPLDFVMQLMEMDENCCLIAVSEQPRVDDVFGLLRAGSRHYLVVPFTVNSLEEVLTEAIEGAPLSEAVLNAPDRNSALVGVILNNLYRQTVLMRQAREFETAARELTAQTAKMIQSVDMAKLFCEGTEEDLLNEIIEACIARANIAASRLGRTRKRLQNKRVVDEDAAA